jgi:nucleotide-binding universal stress UspA family protein
MNKQKQAERDDQMLHKIAVAVDGSDAGYRALSQALEMVDDQGQVLAMDVKDVVSFVQPVTPNTYGGYFPMASLEVLLKDWDDNAEIIRAKVAEMAGHTTVKAEWRTVTVQDGEVSAAQAFLDEAVKEQAQAVVVGRHQGSALIEGMFGSFPRWLVTHSTLPVVVVAPAAH